MTAYYNEFDPFAAQWLRNLIDAGLIAPGVVDDRSITDVTAADLKGFTQCHFFAGIGGWSLALRLAGVSDHFRCWTGSPPCQPFSAAGKQLGQLDDRHLAPTFVRLITQCQPSVIFGEQVAAAIGKHWLDDLFLELENEGYACGAAVLPAASVGAPHKRDRLFFGASMVVHPHNQCESATCNRERSSDAGRASNASCSLVDTYCQQHKARDKGCGKNIAAKGGRQTAKFTGCSSAFSVADANGEGWRDGRERKRGMDECDRSEASKRGERGGGTERLHPSEPASKNHGFWSDADWLGCRDGKFRQVESGSFPLADGIPARVGRLRGYGNAIVPQVAAEFVASFMMAAGEAAQ